MSTATPCLGKWDLFDSVNPRDHDRARALCVNCPILLDCAANAEDMLRTTRKPEGTWGGQLFGMTEKAWKRFASETRAERIDRENARYTDDEARRAHNAYQRGDGSEWARTGHRVYDRRRKVRT